MKTLPDDRRVSADVAAFLADLAFRFVPDAPETASALRVASLSTGKSALRIAVDVRRGVFYGRTYLRYYGIADPGRPPLGAPIDVAYTGLPEIFEATLGRKMTPDESAAIAACVLAAAKDSPEAAAFAAGLDAEALGAFGRIPSSTYGSDPYTWIAGPDPMAGAMKRFVLRYPLLGGIATQGFDAEGGTVEEAYANLTSEFVEKGFMCENRHGAKRTGPIPAGLLARIEGVKPPEHFPVLDEEACWRMVDGIRLARRLPVDVLPVTAPGWMALVDAGTTVWMLTDDRPAERDVAEAMEEGYGAALDFTDAELACVFDPVKGRFDDMPEMRLGDAFAAAAALGRYGVRLAGHGAWLAKWRRSRLDVPEEVLAVDFSELKAALVADGFVTTLRKAADPAGRWSGEKA